MDPLLDLALEGFGPSSPAPSQTEGWLEEVARQGAASRNGGGIWGGVDPGKQGFTALILPDGTIEAAPIPMIDAKTYDVQAVVALARSWKVRGVTHVQVERQQPAFLKNVNPKVVNSLVRSSFQMGAGYYLWLTALMGAGVSHDVVLPRVWKREFKILVGSEVKDSKQREKESKRRAIQACQRFYPDHDLRKSARAKVPNADKAEAILLARYGRLQHGA